MIVIAGLILGAAIGARKALKSGGKRLDAMQYGAGYGIAFALIGLFLTLFIDRMV